MDRFFYSVSPNKQIAVAKTNAAGVKKKRRKIIRGGN